MMREEIITEEEMLHSSPWEYIQKQSQIQKKCDQTVQLKSFRHPSRRSISASKIDIEVKPNDEKIKKKSKDDHPVTEQEHFELRLIQVEISDFIIIEPLKNGKQYQILGENDWKKIIQQKSVAGYNMLDIHISLLTSNIQFCERRDIWLIFCQINLIKEQIKQKQKTFEEYYIMDNAFRKQIEKDIPRAMTGDDFMNKENQSSLRRILMAYANYDPELGYTQGMNIIAANLLICYDLKMNDLSLKDVEIFDPSRDETVFQIFIYIMVELEWRTVFMTGFPGLIRKMKQFEKKFQSELPQLYQHFVDKEVDLNICFQSQFLSLLMYGISWEISRMIFDLFLFEGEAIIHTFLLGMLKYCEERLLKFETFEEIVKFCKGDMIKQFYELFSLQLFGKKDLTNTLMNLGFIKIQGEIKEPEIRQNEKNQSPQKQSKLKQITTNTHHFLKQFFTKKN